MAGPPHVPPSAPDSPLSGTPRQECPQGPPTPLGAPPGSRSPGSHGGPLSHDATAPQQGKGIGNGSPQLHGDGGMGRRSRRGWGHGDSPAAGSRMAATCAQLGPATVPPAPGRAGSPGTPAEPG